MLKPEHNELETRTGPGTPKGALLRRYWIPFLISGPIGIIGLLVSSGL